VNPVTDAGGDPVQVSNFQGGAGTAWFVSDTSRGVRPLIWRMCEKYEFQQITRPENEYVFHNDKCPNGNYARVNAGFGLWLLANRSQQALTAASLASSWMIRPPTDYWHQDGRHRHQSPVMRDWATGLCRSDEGSFDSFIATSIPQFAHLM
jgi:phage major head subunit gpT-like protein